VFAFYEINKTKLYFREICSVNALPFTNELHWRDYLLYYIKAVKIATQFR
jgi:hypothetical protein